MNTQLNLVRKLRSKMVGFLAVCMVMGVAMSLTPSVSMAQSGDPKAGTTIGNQASATYEDSNGDTQTVKSNSVQTEVQQVAAVTISGGVTQTVSPGGTAVFQHTITNNGNDADDFDISTVESSNTFSFSNIQIEDNNGNSITSPVTIGSGGTYTVVVRADVPPGATDGQSETVDVTATSQSDNSVTATAQNTAEVSEGTAVTLNKSLSANSGDVGKQITVTLHYNNTGNSEARNLTIKDPLPAGFDYVTGTGYVNGTNLSDGNDGDSFTYNSSGNGSNGEVTIDVGTVSNGGSGDITFDVKIASGTAGQTISNTANFIHDDISNSQNSNTPVFTVNGDYSVGVPNNGGTIKHGPVSEGETFTFINTFKNTGGSEDIYNITLSGQNNYPAGTNIQLYASDGNGNTSGLLGDSDSDGTPDTGPVQPGNKVEVLVRVQLPAGATDSGPIELIKTATSSNDPSESVSITDKLVEITANKNVDLTNGESLSTNPSADGEGNYPTGESSAVTTNDTDPGTTTEFKLFVNNTGSTADDYDLAASTDNTFGSITLPAGWSVQFKDAGGNPITSTGSIAAGGDMEVKAVVTVPADADYSGAQSIYFRAKSSGSGATDVKHDAVDVNALRNLKLVSDQSGTVSAGGSITYTHTLTNTGNVKENDGSNSTLQLELSNTKSSGFPAKVFYDKDNSGTVTSDDKQVTTVSNSAAVLPSDVGSLQNGEQVQLIVQVEPDADVADGTTNTTTLKTSVKSGQKVGGVGTGSLTVSVNDATTIQDGDLAIEKSQKIKGSGNSYSTGNLNADPGQVIEYKIVVTNQGSAPVNSIDVTDNIPSFTTQDGAVSVSGDGSPSIDNDPGDGSNTGTIKVSVDTLNPGQSFTIKFAAKIDD